MGWLAVLNFLGKEIVITLIFCCGILLFLVGVYLSCCYCNHRQRGRRRSACKRALESRKTDYISYAGVRTSEPSLQRATAPPLVDTTSSNTIDSTRRLSINAEHLPAIAAISHSVLQPVLQTPIYRPYDDLNKITEQPPAYDEINQT